MGMDETMQGLSEHTEAGVTCPHEVIRCFYYGDDAPAPLWSCISCKMRFVPITEVIDAEKKLHDLLEDSKPVNMIGLV